jgi:hypothetical protein
MKRALVLAAVVALAACGAEEPAVESSTTTAVTTTVVSEDATTTAATSTTTTTTPATTGPTVGDEGEPATTSEGDLMAGATPEDLMTNIVADLIGRTGAAESDLTVIRNEAAIWNDGSLGCAVPGQSYTQALVDGYWVVIAYAGVEYDYRASSSGYFKLCEGGGAPPSNPTG